MIIPILSALVPVSAPSDDVCARNTRSCRDRTIAKSSETARPVNTSGRPPFLRRCPRGATFNIVGTGCFADVTVRVSNNIENGTSAARESLPPWAVILCGAGVPPARAAGTAAPQEVFQGWIVEPWRSAESNIQHPISNTELPISGSIWVISGRLHVRVRKSEIRNPKFEIFLVHHLDRDLVIPVDRAGEPDGDDLGAAPANAVEGVASHRLNPGPLAPAGDFEPHVE